MRGAVDFDDIEGWEVAARTPDAHRHAAAMLLAWAEDRNPDDEVTPADLISAAAWHLGRAGDLEDSLDLHRRAVTAEGPTTPDTRSTLIAALLEAGRTEEAREVADQLRRSRPRLVDITWVAESYELIGDLKQAHRWVEMGVSRLDQSSEEDDDDGGGDVDLITLVDARRRIRRALGFQPDELDEFDPRDF